MAARALYELAQGSLSCPVCFDLMDSPMCFRCGHVYCASCANRCISERPMCPLCNSSVQNIRQARPLPALSKLVSFVREIGGSVDMSQSHGDSPCAAVTSDEAPLQQIGPPAVEPDDEAPTPLCREAVATDPQSPRQVQVIALSAAEAPTPSTIPTLLVRNGVGAASRAVEVPSAALLVSGEGHPSPPPASAPFLQHHDQQQQPSSSRGGALSMPTSESQWYRVDVERCVVRDEGTGDCALLYHGGCVLCGLDIGSRLQVTKLLRLVLDTDVSCDEAQVGSVSERTLGQKLGPLWRLHFGAFGRPPAGLSNGSDIKTKGNSACGGLQGGRVASPESVSVLMHQSCLEWCLLRQHIVQGASALILKVAVSVLQSLGAAGGEGSCSFCRSTIGSRLIPCSHCGKRFYHYPCALLTGRGVCLLSDASLTILCAECQAQRYCR